MFPPETRILVADDYVTQRTALKTELRKFGFNSVIRGAENGRVAWEHLEKAHDLGQPFQLIISDWEMPEVSGFELLKLVRGDTRFQHLPMLLVTAVNHQGMVMSAIRAGASNYICKPFSAAILHEKLSKMWQFQQGIQN